MITNNRREMLARLRAQHQDNLQGLVDEQVAAVAAVDAAIQAKEDILGAVMEDGTIYAGVSPDTGEGLYVMAPPAGKFNHAEASDYIYNLNNGTGSAHAGWDLPTPGELQLLFDNREKGALKRVFNVKAVYWSSETFEQITPYDGQMMGKVFNAESGTIANSRLTVALDAQSVRRAPAPQIA